MYRYDQYDHLIVRERIAQYRDQVARRLNDELTEEEFLPLRLQNGLYMQRHAYMLRIAVPYGLLSSAQMRMFGHIARKYDRGYGHFTTRQNIQFNWIELEHTPDILADLASVEMHAIQTSGNCIRNITTDEFAGVAADEHIDPRPFCEVLRQWSTFHPEFAALPRKFKVAINGSAEDRAAMIRDHLRDAIVDRRLAPGTKLNEAEVGTLFDVSRTVVRAALQALAFEGLVRTERNRGAFVANPTPDEARQVFAARRLIEPGLALAAAQRILQLAQGLTPDDLVLAETVDPELARG